MFNKKIGILIGIIIILCTILVATIVFTSAKETEIAIDLNEINQGDNITITLTDSDGNVLSNKIVHITINGVTYNKTTDEMGHIQLPINLNPDNYNISVTFDGELFKYKSTITIQNLKVNDNNTNNIENNTDTSSTDTDTDTSSETSDKLYNAKTNSYVDKELSVKQVGSQDLGDGYRRDSYEDGYFRVIDSDGNLVNYGYAA